jgi:hypothetical protein
MGPWVWKGKNLGFWRGLLVSCIPLHVLVFYMTANEEERRNLQSWTRKAHSDWAMVKEGPWDEYLCTMLYYIIMAGK